MSIRVLPPVQRQPSLAELLGAGVGRGLETGITGAMEERAQMRQLRAQEEEKRRSQMERQRELMGLYQMLSGREYGVEPGMITPTEREIAEERIVPERREEKREPIEPAIPSEESVAAMTMLDPNLGRLMAQERKQAIQAQREEKKAVTQKEQFLIKQNQKKYEEIVKDLQTNEAEQMRLERLDELSESGQIAPAWRIWPFYSEGKLKTPFLFSPETQEFMKIVADFTRGARDSFGARVTNFELGVFLQKLPSLMNTPKGRKMIIHNLSTMSQLNELRDKGIKEAFDEAGGLGKITFDQAEKRMRQKYGKEIQRLKKEYIKPSITAKEAKIAEKQKPAKSKQMEGYTRMIDPRTRREMWIKNEDLDEARGAGWKIVGKR